MISIKNLNLGYIREFYALYNINLEIAKGEKVAIIGGENSGKTSLLRILAQLQDFTSGEVTINDIPLRKLDYSIDLSVGFIAEHPILFENKSVRKNLEYVLKIRKIEKNKLINLANDVLRDFSLDKLADVKVKHLTLYQKRLLQFAMLSIRDKIDLLLIDQIFDLEDTEKETIMKIAQTFMDREGTTSIIATDSEEISQRMCTRIVRLSLGSIQDDGEKKCVTI